MAAFMLAASDSQTSIYMSVGIILVNVCQSTKKQPALPLPTSYSSLGMLSVHVMDIYHWIFFRYHGVHLASFPCRLLIESLVHIACACVNYVQIWHDQLNGMS